MRRPLHKLFGFAEYKFSGRGTALEVRLHQQRCIGQGRLFRLDLDFSGAAGICHRLRVKRGRAGSGKAESQSGTRGSSSSLGHSELHCDIAIGEHGVRIKPLDFQLFDSGEGFRLGMVKYMIELSLADRVEHKPVLFPKLLLFLGVAELNFRCLVGVRGRPFANAAAAHKHLRLQQELTFAGFTLYVVDSVAVLNIGIETKNHSGFYDLIISYLSTMKCFTRSPGRLIQIARNLLYSFRKISVVPLTLLQLNP